MTDEERLRALFGNLKSWGWTVFPQYKIEREDAEVLLDATKEMQQRLSKLHTPEVQA